MAKVITFSRHFPAYHPRAGQPTFFVEQFLNSNGYSNFKKDFLPGVREIINDFVIIDGQAKHHTIRAGNRFKAGDYFSPRVWSGKPYNSKQIIIGSDTEIKKVWDVVIFAEPYQTTICLPTEKQSQFQMLSLGEVAENDGLTIADFESWFNPKKKSIEFQGQIICWNESINY